MAIYNFNDPFIISKNESAVEIPSETITVVNGKAILRQIPDRFRKIEIPGYFEISEGANLTQNNFFYCNYKIGELTFHPSVVDGTKLNAHYYGWGVIQTPVERIYYRNDNDVVQSLEYLIANGYTALETLATIGDTVNKVNNIKLVELTNKVVLLTDSNTVNIGIANFDSSKDVLIVAKNTTLLTKGVDYTLSGSTITEINNQNWLSETEFDFIVHRISY